MTLRSDILARFKSEGGAAPLFLPDLTLWHAWHRERDTLPSAWRDFTLPQAARHLNAPIWAVVRPWQAATPGVTTTSEESSWSASSATRHLSGRSRRASPAGRTATGG